MCFARNLYVSNACLYNKNTGTIFSSGSKQEPYVHYNLIYKAQHI